MRFVCSRLALIGLLLLVGCNHSKWGMVRNGDPGGQRFSDQTPRAEDLVAYLNTNAHQIQSLTCPEVDLDCRAGIHQIAMRAKMACQKPRDFRLIAEVAHNTQADIGSNQSEFWYWIAKGDPYLFHCSYSDLARGVRIPFPFQPEWVIEALGLAEYDPSAANYRVAVRGDTIELVNEARNAQGQPVRRVTVFSRAPSAVQVREHVLRDQADRVICSAQIFEVYNYQYQGQSVIVPKRVVLNYPAERMVLKLNLGHDPRDVIVNQTFDPEQARTLFTRPLLSGVATYDLARGPDRPTSQVRQAGGFLRR